MESTSLKTVWQSYNGKEKTMEGKNFVKICKDSGLIDKKLTTTDVDLIFSKIKGGPAERRITFDQFSAGLGLIAVKKGTDAEGISGIILSQGGPKFTGTKAEANKFHDDKSLYTGVHSQGGPTTVDEIPQTSTFGQSIGGTVGANEEEKASPPKKAKAKIVESTSEPAGSLEEVFLSFSGGAPEMEGKTFAKLAKDCALLDKKLTATDMDLIFAKIKTKAARKITFAQF
jgi:hypothetical protein